MFSPIPDFAEGGGATDEVQSLMVNDAIIMPG